MLPSCLVILLLLVTFVDCKWDPLKNPKEFAEAQKQNAKKDKARIKSEYTKYLKDLKAGKIKPGDENRGKSNS